MFRVRIRIDPDRLRAHREAVKSGVPGVAYVLLDPKVAWPDSLRGSGCRMTNIEGNRPYEWVIYRYRAIVALDSVSLEVPAGKIVGIVGPDGVGKIYVTQHYRWRAAYSEWTSLCIRRRHEGR